jgi:HlyD family secretion protein
MQVWASVNEADIGHITSGQSVRFTVDAFPREVFRGVVAPDQPRLNASMNQNVVTYTVVVNTDNSKGRLLPYLTADLQFEVAKHSQVLFVPNAALRWRPTPERLAASGLSASAIEPPAKDVDKAVDADGMAAGDGTVWLVEGARVKPVKVRTGLSDGTRTEVSAPELSEGAVVAIAEQYTATADPAADPFSPKVFSGGGKRQQQ